MATNNMHNLTTLIKRLEAATARLEDIATSTIELPQAVPALSHTLASPIAATSPAPTPAPTGSPALKTVVEEPFPESIEDFDIFISQSVERYVDASNKLGGLIAEQAAKVLEGFKQQRRFLLVSTKAKKPDFSGSEMAVYQDLLKPINEALMAVGNIKESNRGSPVFSQLSAVAEGIMVLAWVTVDNRPYKHVEESLGSAQFFGNRVLKEYKDKDAAQVAWIQAFYQVFKDLTEYVKQYFPSGIPWNPKGLPAAEIAKEEPPPLHLRRHLLPQVVRRRRPPPPGPPPVLQIKEEGRSAEPASGASLGAVFSEINKGSDVTKGLRKVDRSEMTHKNPALRAASVVPDREASGRGKSPAPARKPKPESMRAKKPPKKELDGNKWLIENYERHPEPIEIDASINHSILISKCNHTTVIIKGKANAVTVENTQRLSIVVDSLVSTVDVVKSSNFALQVMGVIPTVMMDQMDGATVYLSRESTATRIFSSKSAGINLNILDNDEDDYKEVPLPSQMCHYFDEKKGQLVNEIVEHAG
ncbi:Adenylyl cyclase-associated protein [Apiospora hydei]|uniref:Adenylyl cyclase-associated protein n=1 Tax=Apiospora hydei TaxID=1337664 RepID=A0ABR1WAC0_9PEZI